jgi:hypothetical protein
VAKPRALAELSPPESLARPSLRRAADVPELPERRLMAAVLRDALGVFERHLLEWDSPGRRRFEETAAWFASDDLAWPFSFRNICQELALDAEAIRARLQRWRRRRLEELGGGPGGGAGDRWS